MDNRSIMLLEIDNYLNDLIRIVKLRNSKGYFDVNKVSENRAIGLFNLIYGFDLKNANNILSDNFPAIDLVDFTASTVIQVTATSESDKVIYTLEKFIEYELYKSYNRVIVYILTEKPKNYTSKTIKKFSEITKKYINFDHKKDIIDNSDLSKSIDSFININHIKDVHKYLTDELSNSKSDINTLPKELNAFAKYRIDNLIGRNTILDEIDKKLIDRDLVLLYGVGGIGKTAIAKSYLEIHKDDYDHLAYVDVTDSLPSSLFKKLGSIDSSFFYDYEESVSVNLYNLINKLHVIKRTLLVIDNCDNSDELRQFKQDLESFQWKILITSRAFPSTYNSETVQINHLAPELAYELFTNNYRILKEDEKEIVNRILKKIKYHTKLAIILAKAAFNNPLLKLEELADQVYKEAYKDEKINVLVSLDSEEYPVYEFLLLLFKPELLNSDQQKYLKYFSILPNQEISVEHLVHMFERNEKQGFFINIINKLTEKGWIEKYENYFRIHPLIQLVTKEKLHITVNNCGQLIDNLIYYLNQPNNFIESKSYLPFGESVLNFFKDESVEKIGILANYLSTVNIRLHYFNSAFKCASIAVEVFESEKKHTQFLAQAYGNKADICSQMSLFREAETLLNKTINVQSKFLHKNHHDVATTYSKFSNLYFKEARNETVKHNKIAIYYKSIDYSNEAISIYERNVLKYRNLMDIRNLCTTYNSLAIIYEDLYYLKNEANLLDLHLEFDDKALSLAKKHLGDNDPTTAYVYNNNGLNLLKLNQFDLAQEYIEKALEIRKIVFQERHPEIGVSLYNLARVFIAKHQRINAVNLLLQSIDILEESNHEALDDAKKLYKSIK